MKTLARERDRAELLVRLKTLHPDSARRWGRMSSHQAVCHMSDAFLMGLGQKPVTRIARLGERTLVKWIGLYLPVPWPAGRIRTTRDIDQEADGTKPNDFAADVARLEGLVDMFTTRAKELDRQAHPLFGRMSPAAWLRWGYLHMDHHLRQFGA